VARWWRCGRVGAHSGRPVATAFVGRVPWDCGSWGWNRWRVVVDSGRLVAASIIERVTWGRGSWGWNRECAVTESRNQGRDLERSSLRSHIPIREWELGAILYNVIILYENVIVFRKKTWPCSTFPATNGRAWTMRLPVEKGRQMHALVILFLDLMFMTQY
jgi:hypothetical protein